MTKTKSIVVTLIALLVLSMFSGSVLAGRKQSGNGNGSGVIQDGIVITNDAPAVAVEQSVEDKSRSFSIGEIASCLDAKLKRGDRASFVFEDNEYSIRQGLVGDRYTQLSLQGLAARFYSGDAKRYDFDADGNDDVQVAVYDLLNGNAYLSVCGLEDRQDMQDEAVEVSQDVENQETLSFLDKAFSKITSWFN